MGLFLNISLVKGAEEEIKKEILDFKIENEINKITEQNILYSKIKKINTEVCSILYPQFCTTSYEFSHFLAKSTHNQLITISIHDNDYWYFNLFNNENELTRFISNVEFLEQGKNDWNCDYDIVAKEFNANREELRKYLENIQNTDCFEPVNDFLNLLNLPAKQILTTKNYHSVLDDEILNEFKSPQITIEDLRSTKRYIDSPIPISNEDVIFLLGNEIIVNDHLEFHNEIYGTNYKELDEVRFLLNVDSLTIQVEVKFPQNPESEIFIGIGIHDRMEKIYDFLNN